MGVKIWIRKKEDWNKEEEEKRRRRTLTHKAWLVKGEGGGGDDDSEEGMEEAMGVEVCWLVACSMSQQDASVSQGQICLVSLSAATMR